MANTKQDIEKQIFKLRELILELAEETKDLEHNRAFYDLIPEGRDIGEMRANITLAYRHMEDARMRLGKVVQAYDGGKSCYPK